MEKELAEKLRDAGSKLERFPSDVDQLLSLLDEIENLLEKVEQSPLELIQDGYSKLMKALLAERLIRHTDADVQVSVASCISEITRITAPEAPYEDDQMKEVFQLIVSSFADLSNKSSRSYDKRASILETVAKSKLCVVLLDLECDGLISEMFQHFISSIRDDHPKNIFESMTTIMTVVLEECEDVPIELLMPILASLRRKNEEITTIARKLGESVLAKCAAKLNPFLKQAVEFSGLSLDGYSKIVTTICNGSNGEVELDDINVSEGQKMEGSFTSLLNEGTFSEFEDMVFTQPPPQSQSQPQQEASKQKKGKGKRSKNFLIEEDTLLVSAWLNVSLDPVQGNNQTHKCYWDRIWNYYEENKGGLVSDRTANSLCNRWCTINEKVAKFIGICNKIFGRNQSGLSEQDKIDQALEMYEQVMKEKFMFFSHWCALRFAPKFQSSLEKKNKVAKDRPASSQSVDSQVPTSLESDEILERPIGRKAAKKLKRAANEATEEESLELLKAMQKDALAIASSTSEAVNRSLQLQKEMMQLQKEEHERQKEIMQLQKEKLQLRLAKEERERQREERERQVYETSIMAMDTSKMLPDQAKYYDALKARIMRNIL